MTTQQLRVRTAVDELAVFGGQPLFTAPLHVGRPNLPPYERVEARVRRIFERRWLTNHGPEVLEFERAIASFAGVRHCIGVCNATVGLEVAIRALGMTGEVIVPAFTFVATAHALAWQGITPVFCDIDPKTHLIDPAKVEALITPRTTGIIGVHLWGRACDVEALEEIARRRGLRLLFDAAHAFGCARGGRPVGSFGDAEIFSFHATKFLNTFEGGAIVTNDDAFARQIRLTTNFGFVDYDEVVSVGTNGKMTEVAAAMGLASLERMDDVIALNRRHHEQYVAGLADLPGVTVAGYSAIDRPNYQYVAIEIDAERAGIDRDVVLEVLHGEQILARRYFYPGVHRMEPYRTTHPGVAATLPATEKLARSVLILPTGTAVSSEDITRICDLIAYCIENGGEIARRLPNSAFRVARDLR